MSDRMLHIAIDVSLAEDQIHGQVDDGVRRPRPFSGWLGLIGQLDELLGSPRQPGAANGERVRDHEQPAGRKFDERTADNDAPIQ